MLFEVYGRFRLDILRQDDGWVAYRVEPGKRIKLPELAIPASLEGRVLPEYLDDLYHGMSRPGETVRRIDEPA